MVIVLVVVGLAVALFKPSTMVTKESRFACANGYYMRMINTPDANSTYYSSSGELIGICAGFGPIEAKAACDAIQAKVGACETKPTSPSFLDGLW